MLKKKYAFHSARRNAALDMLSAPRAAEKSIFSRRRGPQTISSGTVEKNYHRRTKCNFNLLYLLISGSTLLDPFYLIKLVTLGDVASARVGEIFNASKIEPAGRIIAMPSLSLPRHEHAFQRPEVTTRVFQRASFQIDVFFFLYLIRFPFLVCLRSASSSFALFYV